MAGPWEKYAQQPAQNGPWAKYGAQPAQQPAEDPSIGATIKQGVGDLAAGAVRGAGSIGATILSPLDAAARALNDGKPVSIGGVEVLGMDRRTGMDEGLRTMGANPDSLLFKAGKIGTEIAGTLGAGGAVANVARRVVPAAAQATPLVSNLIRAVETSGAQGGNLLSRSAGSAITGAASAGMVNPEEIGMGALVGGAAPSVLQATGKVGSAIGKMLRGGTTDAQRLAAARTAQQAGYVIPPSDIQQQGALTEALGGLSGKIKTAQEASARNQAVTNKLAAKELGLPEGQPITMEALDAVRAEAGKAYEAVAKIGKLPAKSGELPKSVAVQKYTDKMTFAPKSEVDSAELVRAWKQANHDATAYYRAYGRDANPETLAKAKQAANEAAQIDKFLERALTSTAKQEAKTPDQLIGELAKGYISKDEFLRRVLAQSSKADASGNRGLLDALKAARIQIAKTYTVEKALNGTTGDVSAQVLAKELAKGKPLSGNLLSAAKAGQAFPRATQALKEAPKAISPLDWAVSAMSGTATGNPLMLATLGARPMVRNALLSAPVQSYAARDIGPSALTRALTPQNQLLVRRALPVLAADQ